MSDECKHGMTPEFCADCRGLTLADPKPVVEYTFPARYGGRCDGCDRPFAEGELIGKTDEGGYVCPRCLR